MTMSQPYVGERVREIGTGREGVLLNWGRGESTFAPLGTAAVMLDSGEVVRFASVEDLQGRHVSHYPSPDCSLQDYSATA
jgi:hypothetical protein